MTKIMTILILLIGSLQPPESISEKDETPTLNAIHVAAHSTAHDPVRVFVPAATVENPYIEPRSVPYRGLTARVRVLEKHLAYDLSLLAP